jgi:hypothetical protein
MLRGEAESRPQHLFNDARDGALLALGAGAGFGDNVGTEAANEHWARARRAGDGASLHGPDCATNVIPGASGKCSVLRSSAPSHAKSATSTAITSARVIGRTAGTRRGALARCSRRPIRSAPRW